MTGLLETLFTFLLSAFTLVLDTASAVGALVWGVLYHLHVDAPRLEGLLVGVALAWLLVKREKHPILRAMSAPLKLVIDILDLVWDQCAEFVKDIWEVSYSWLSGIGKWGLGVVTITYKGMIKSLSKIRNSLKKKK
jgi:hypothetical protein